MPALFDTHCHLQLHHFNADREAVLQRARAAGVARVLNIGTSLDDAQSVLDLAACHGLSDQSPECYAALGWHPGYMDTYTTERDDALAEMGRRERARPGTKLIVWGEIGLDYFHKPFDAALQQRVFRRQLAIARELALPVSMHCREAYADLIAILREEARAGLTGGVQHCFMGSVDDASALVDLGFTLGVGGAATYPKSGALRDVLKAVGIAHLILETDAPYLPPQGRRGTRNEPAYVAETAKLLGEAWGMDAAELIEETTRNAERSLLAIARTL